jgi:hypothetical protein
MFGLSRRKGSGPSLVMASFISVTGPTEPPADHAQLHARKRGVAPAHKAMLATVMSSPPSLGNRAPATPRRRSAAQPIAPAADPQPVQGGASWNPTLGA